MKKSPLPRVRDEKMEYADMLQNEFSFLKSLQEVEIPKRAVEIAKSHLVPPPKNQLEEHYRLIELLNLDEILKERHLDSSSAAATFAFVKKIYIQAIPILVERWN